MADTVRRIVTADVYAWMTPIEDVPGRWHHNIAVHNEEIEVSPREAERGESLGLLEDPAKRRETDESVAAEEAVAVDELPADRPEAPAPAASKARWVDYAVARGMDRDDAEGMTRDELATALRA